MSEISIYLADGDLFIPHVFSRTRSEISTTEMVRKMDQ